MWAGEQGRIIGIIGCHYLLPIDLIAQLVIRKREYFSRRLVPVENLDMIRNPTVASWVSNRLPERRVGTSVANVRA